MKKWLAALAALIVPMMVAAGHRKMYAAGLVAAGGIIAPVMWTGLIYATLEFVNPIMNARIDWRWFIASQFAFGIVAGLVVARHTPVRTLQYLPFAVRAGFEAGGLEHDRHDRGAQAVEERGNHG